MLYLFITGNRSAYMNNIFSVMSLPQGWSYELKYKEKGGIIDEESKKLSENSSEEVLILFVREEDDVYIPLRMGRLVGIVKDEGQMYYSVRLGQYCNWNGKSEFCEWLHRLLGNDIRHLTYETKDSADGKLVIRSNQKPINELEKKEDSWIKTVRELGKEDLFKKYYSVFTKVEIDGKVDFGENGKKAFVRSGQNYIARITYYIPDFNNSPMDTLPIEFKGRKSAEKQMRSVIAFLEKESSMNKYVRGIDTCASELDCRPEVYAQIYRYMTDFVFKTTTDMRTGRRMNKKLRMTYHVGEDFLDIVDGLRAIDEVLLFCGVRRGSRLGHALALGIDPEVYYQYKNKKIVLSKQILLDDLAWILVKAKETGCRIDSELKAELQEKFYYLYAEIYGKVMNGMDDISWMDYYESWKLRGDNPELYTLSDEEYESRMMNPRRELKRFDRYAFNDVIGDQGCTIRGRKKLRKLYWAYHYSESVRKKGNEQVEFKVDQRYAELVRQLQDKMIALLVRENISIETNPSSNYLIGTIRKYDEHPILRFNSRYLEKTEKNMSLHVSINTDDQGVFDTLLENEYALMMLALKKKQNEDNQLEYDIEDIYEWIDYVRQMGLEQSFKTIKPLKEVEKRKEW